MRITIDRLFEESSYSMAELTHQTGLRQQRIEAIISGRWLASPRERKVIADAFTVAVEDIDWRHTMCPRNVRYHRFGLREDLQ